MTRFRIIGGLIAIGVLILLALFLSGMISSLFTAKQEARVSKGQAGASIDSGAEATNTVAELLKSDAQTKAVVEQGLEDIRNAPEAEKDAVAVRALCRLKVYAATPRCQPTRSE